MGVPSPGGDRDGEGGRLDPLRHPDLIRIARRLRDDLDETLEAEQHAALTAARRRLTLRDRLLEAEDRQAEVTVATTDGQLHRGRAASVGSDHLVVVHHSKSSWIALDHIVSVQVGA